MSAKVTDLITKEALEGGYEGRLEGVVAVRDRLSYPAPAGTPPSQAPLC